MKNLEAELTEKKALLDELIKSRSKAKCSSTYSSKTDVERETQIEELEEEIEALESRLKT